MKEIGKQKKDDLWETAKFEEELRAPSLLISQNIRVKPTRLIGDIQRALFSSYIFGTSDVGVPVH